MSLHLYMHPLSSYCHKVLIALYENDTAFEPHTVDLGDPASRAAFVKIWPIGKFPVLVDDARGVTVPESTTIIEYLSHHYPGREPLVPQDEVLARQTRLRDRFFDLYVHNPMQRIVADRIRPANAKDPHGVEESKSLLRTAYAMIEQDMANQPWAMGDRFSMADCAAAPALFYADKVLPMAANWPNVAAYLERIKQRPSYVRVLAEAAPYFHMFPAG
jgi:glutathione S-transferase